ncbi:MAG: hypothetical protein OXE52_05255 [Chloroflexi bacterium]|nr:hypothetical protein [Chloroflexota bacterium]
MKTTIMMVGAAVTFIAAIILIADIKCSYDIENWWAPLYPNGETVSVEYDLFRPRALGMTTWILETSDDVETVKQFYRDKRLEVLKAEKSRGIAWSDSFVQPLENGPGSRIIISSACGT